MAPTQTIVMTVIPRGIAMNTDTLPVSVFVTPRLVGPDKLGSFPDWLIWTRLLKEKGLTLTLRCGGNELNVPVDPQPLDPDLWEALFKEDTFVRSHVFDDYSGKPVMSYSVRQALSVLKSMYQQAGIDLALPDDAGAQSQERGNRLSLRQLLDGLDVNWSPRDGERWRDLLRKTQAGRRGRSAATIQSTAQLDAEGLVPGTSSAAAKKSVAVPFAVFHHMPTPKGPDDKTPVPKLDPDWDTQLDFHQALGSLNAYESIQRALGVVFDFELPLDFVPLTAQGQYETLSVSGVIAAWDWEVEPETPELETACVHLSLGETRLFLTAPRMLDDPTAEVPPILGLLDLSPLRFGLAQVDVDGGMHKAIIQAETWHPGPGRNLNSNVEPDAAAHPEVFDPEATLPALRSGGFSLYADERALQLLDLVGQSKAFNDALEKDGSQPRPFFAEDLVRGYRLDVWDSHANEWRSLHFRDATYKVENGPSHVAGVEEGFVQLAVMQPAPGAEPESDDLYLHEAVARWAGWSLAVEMPGLHVSSSADPAKALESEPVNEPVTPFKLTTSYGVVEGTLPSLRFGRRYRLRARAVDLAGGGLEIGDTVADLLSILLALPRDPEGFAYLRYEPVDAPLVVIRDESAVTGAGSAVDRLVIRTRNDDPAKDADAADLAGSERHILPPRTSVELGERLGMFDTPTGKLRSDATTWNLIAKRDAAELKHSEIEVAGHVDSYPLEPGESVTLPYLPDLFSRGAAIRDLPATPSGAIGKTPASGAADKVAYDPLSDPNPRPGSATLVSFGEDGDWKGVKGFRLVLGEPAAGDSDPRPSWDPVGRVLTVPLPKGGMTTVPLSSYLLVDDLKLMGQWQWLRQYVELLTIVDPDRPQLVPGTDVDRIAHVLQRAVEGGHWLLSPPRLLTLVNAVQQPIGRPEFAALDLEHDPEKGFDPDPLQTKPISGRPDPTELAPITAWRRPGSTDAYLMGALRVHGASTVRVDIDAAWTDVVDDPDDPAAENWHKTVERKAPVDALPLPDLLERELFASGRDFRRVGHYDPEHDQIAFVRAGDTMGGPDLPYVFPNAAPRHAIGDTKHHVVTYKATSTSRFREYFPPDLDFTRESGPVVVDVPASERPLAPSVVYVVPTFGWQRQTETNLMRSVRFGGGLRVYLDRPWFSSGEGELLGVALWNTAYGTLDAPSRDKFKPFITQWGMDPIWKTASILPVPMIHNFPDAVAFDRRVTLEERTAMTGRALGLVDVVGFEPQFDEERGLWFADLTVEIFGETYMPFVRLALVRYQPNALLDAKVSRVVLADFAQLTPDRSAMVTCDPHHPRRLNVVVSGVAPTGPSVGHGRPTQITVRVQERDPQLPGDLGWRDASAETATVTVGIDGPAAGRPNIAMWAGSVFFAETPEVGRFRLLVEEHELIAPGEAIITGTKALPRGRLIYAETFELDSALLASD